MRVIIILLTVLYVPYCLGEQGGGPETQAADSTSVEHPKHPPDQADLAIIAEKLAAIADHTATDKQSLDNQAMREQAAIDVAERDLVQQESMAKFTRLIYLVTVVGTVGGIIGIGLLGWTLWETRRTANAAVKQASQDRAWVLIDTDGCTTEATEDGINFSVPIRNFGNTPAVDARVKWMVAAAQLEASIEGIPVDMKAESVAGLMSPGAPFTLQYTANSTEDRFIAFIVISYETVHGDKAITQQVIDFTRSLDVLDKVYTATQIPGSNIAT